MTRFLLTLIMMTFMTLGPVASLAAQINHTDMSHHATLQMADQDQITEEVKPQAQQSEQMPTHNCCEDDCACSFQNECDIQHLTFFAIPPHDGIPSRIEKTISTSSYLVNKIYTSFDNIYRPPIVLL